MLLTFNAAWYVRWPQFLIMEPNSEDTTADRRSRPVLPQPLRIGKQPSYGKDTCFNQLSISSSALEIIIRSGRTFVPRSISQKDLARLSELARRWR